MEKAYQELDKLVKRNGMYEGISFIGILFSTTTMIAGLLFSAIEPNPSQSDILKEYHSAQQSINVLRNTYTYVRNPQYLDEIISGIESKIQRIEKEKNDEILAYNERVEKMKDDLRTVAKVSLIGLTGSLFAMGYFNKKKNKLASIRDDLLFEK